MMAGKTRFVFALSAVRDGREVEASRFELEHTDYNGWTDESALRHVLDNKAQFGIGADEELDLIQLGGVTIPRSQFGGLRVRLLQKGKLPAEG